MPEIIPINLEPTVVKGVNELVRHCILHPFLVVYPILTHEDTILRRKSARGGDGAWMTLKGVFGERTACKAEVLEHKHHHRA